LSATEPLQERHLPLSERRAELRWQGLLSTWEEMRDVLRRREHLLQDQRRKEVLPRHCASVLRRHVLQDLRDLLSRQVL
jgi:hypothetical protein